MDRWKSLWTDASGHILLKSAWRHGLRSGSPAAFAFAGACVAIATLARLVLGLATSVLPFATFYPATLIATLVGGLWVGIMAAVAGGLIGYVFLASQFAPEHPSLPHITNVLLYSATSLIIVWGAEQYGQLVRRLDQEEQYRRVLVEELRHRLQNKLATTQAILRHELRGHPEIWESVAGRLRTLSATDEFIAESNGEGIDLVDILKSELAPYDGSRTTLRGDAIHLPPKLAVVLALIFHELATNASKYGAFSTSEGHVHVSWGMAGGRLVVDWLERDGPRVFEPVRRGFGRRLIEEGLHSFGGNVECGFDPAGLRCKIEVPLPVSVPHPSGQEPFALRGS
jgi:two-component sensor histidine kinase